MFKKITIAGWVDCKEIARNVENCKKRCKKRARNIGENTE